MLKYVKLEYVNLCNETLKQCHLLSFKTINNALKWSFKIMLKKDDQLMYRAGLL